MKKTLLIIIAILMMVPTARAQYSGECGDNLTWIFDDNTGTLTISGTGDMWDSPSFGNLKITAVIIQEGVTSIGAYAFGYKPYLSSVSIPNTVVSIGDNAFIKCDYLKSITIPNSVTTIGMLAFCRTGIESLTLGNSVSSIGIDAFANCPLKSIVIPNSLKTISEGVFSHCFSLESVDFGDSLVSIDQGAFSMCTALTTLDFPNTLRSIGKSAFWNCYSLQSVNFSESLESIGEGAFVLCVSLNSIKFPNSLSLIEESAFGSISNIREVYCMAITPPNCVSDNTFDNNVYMSAPLYVPIGCKSLYENASSWKKFNNIVETGELIDENLEENFSVFPNPSSDFINISCDNMKSLEIVSMTGKSVMKTSVSTDEININISGLTSGIYIVIITTEQGCFTKEIVKR